jgi:ABC-type sugar transport system ATPase subunit
VLYVSHRLPDILEVCTRVVVLRGGELAVDGPASDFDPERLARALVPELREHVAVETTPGDSGLRLGVADAMLSARKGEVVGIFGMAGGEQFDIAARLAGLAGPTTYELGGKAIRVRNPAHAIRQRVFYVPPDRDTEGLVASESAKDNVMLPWYRSGRSRGWWVSDRTGSDVYAAARAALDIRGPDGLAEISQFSGGNRQKHLLSRWLYPSAPNLLLLCQPTQGVDVGARLDIVDAIRSAAQKDAAVLVASSESDEIASMCDRSYVVVGDKTAHVDKGDSFNERLLAALLSLAASPAHDRSDREDT